MLSIQTATRQKRKLKIALIGASGSGKTFSALSIAKGLGDNVLLLDSEHGSASVYADFGFQVAELPNFDPVTYANAIREAESLGYDVLIVDSLSHAWMGAGGALEQVESARLADRSGNSFAAWRNVTPKQNQMVEAIVGARIHIIATLRAKTEYVQERNEKTGKTQVRKVGLAPVQRDGLEYEFDVVGDLDENHTLVITKTRCPEIDGRVFPRPDSEFGRMLANWMNSSGPSAPAPSPDDHALTDALLHWNDLLAEGERYGIARRDLPEDATFGTVRAYCDSLSKAIERKKQAAPTTPLAQAVHTVAEQAAQNSNAEEEDVFDQPEIVEAPPPEKPKTSRAQLAFLAKWRQKEVWPLTGETTAQRNARIIWMSDVCEKAGFGRIASSKDLTAQQAAVLCDALDRGESPVMQGELVETREI